MTATEIALLSAGLTSIIGPIIVHLFQSYTSKNNKDLIKESLKTNSLVEDKIEYLREKYQADRVSVCQFHNGGYFYPTGKSIQKFSMFYESVSEGIYSNRMSFQNIPVSLFNRVLTRVSEEDIISIPDFITNTTGSEYGFMGLSDRDSLRSKSIYIFAIRNITGRFIGFISFGFVENQKIFTQQELTHLALEISTIGGVLMTGKI